MSLEQRLSDWVDVDRAIVVLAEELGIMPRAVDWQLLRSLIETNNEVTRALYGGLEAFVAAGLVERREADDIEYRWIGGEQLTAWRRRHDTVVSEDG